MEKSEQISNYRNVRPGQGKPAAQPGSLSLSLPLEIGKGHGVSAFCSVGTKDAPQSSFETETHPVFLKQVSVSAAVGEAGQGCVLGALVICISHCFRPELSEPPLNSQIEISAASLRDLGQK